MPEYVAVSRERHGQRRWRRFEDYGFARGEVAVPIVAAELPRVVLTLPIAFVRAGGDMVPAALLGLQPGQNLYVAPDGRFLASYVPAALRSYPFRLLAHPEPSRGFVLCVDETSLCLTMATADDEPFFTSDGQPTQAIAGLLKHLEAVEANRPVTARATAALLEAGVLEPWPLKVGERDVQGLQRVAEGQLARLEPEALVRLRDTGALTLAYAQFFSMGHLPTLARLAELQGRTRAAVQPIAEDLEFDFDNLA
ncbi:MAG: SapC family protein [Pseudomonadota bacterium]